ncbi:hypothetical protein [uncultured Microbacterium sp.]|uniref:hypothetical protein n=1 Tax=uncultured Microbacterium sp. TaxID=191216 RepID=UPI0025CCAB5B|nr:hypothetical protein [uncultured Microbacterium sp.]
MNDIPAESSERRTPRTHDANIQPAEELHPAVGAVLLAAAQDSVTARGARRREAFRTARFLLAGCRLLGQPRSSIAELLGVRMDTISSRSSVEGDIHVGTFARLAGVDVAVVEEWRHRGDLPAPTFDLSGRVVYPAADLLAALIRNHGQRW